MTSGSGTGALLRVITDAGADSVYLADPAGRTVTFAGLAAAVTSWSTRFGGARRVLLDIADPVDFALVHLSVIASGRISVPVDPAAPAGDLQRTHRGGAVELVVSSQPGRWADVPVLGLEEGEHPGAPPPARGGVLMQTSGSTGDPKLIELSEHRLLHVARAVAAHNGLTPLDRGHNALPLFHINGQVVGLLATLVSGGTLLVEDRFHRTGFWDRTAGVTWINAVPAMLGILARDPLSRRPGLRFVRSASAPLPPAVRSVIVDGLGVPVIESYGMTEAASQITATDPDDDSAGGTVGRPIGCELQVRDAVDGVGEVWIRGPGIVTSYADGRAADRFDDERWLCTGDLGSLDASGRLRLHGRSDDVINRGGELIYPREVEEVLLSDPGVTEAVVVARSHEILGQVPVAQVVTTGPDDSLLDRVDALCRRQLSPFKRPVAVEVVDSFPRASVGKIRRHLVRDRVRD